MSAFQGGCCIKYLKSLVIHLKSWYILYETPFRINEFLSSDVQSEVPAMTAVIYARYSSDNQREESIEGQIRE